MKYLMVIALALALGCKSAPLPAPLPTSVWINPVVVQQAASSQVKQLRADLQNCAISSSALPRSCKAPSKSITTVTAVPANCHWQCGSICADKSKCAWEVVAGEWTLEYQRPATLERVRSKACSAQEQRIFDDPQQYEQMSCEQECFQKTAIVAMSKVDPGCAMDLFGIMAARPACIGPIPAWCTGTRDAFGDEEAK